MESKHVVVGLGGCGGALATLYTSRLKREGITNVETYLFNTSKQDMAGMQVDKFYMLGLKDENGNNDTLFQGCGKERELGKKIALQEEEEIRQFFNDVKNSENKTTSISIIFSSGGGTGSGFSVTFVNICKEILGKDVPIFVHMIKPFSYETIPNVNNINNLMEFTGILAKKQVVFNIIDNDVISEKINSSDFELINKEIVESFLLLNYDYIDKHSKPCSSFSLDKSDFYRIVSQKGNTAGLVSIYGYKGGKFRHIYNLAGIENEAFEGARKVLCVVRDSKFIKNVQADVKRAGVTNVLEFKAMNFDNTLVGNDNFEAFIFAIGEPKTDNIVDDMMVKFSEAQATKAEVAKKDDIKENLKERSIKKVKIKF